MISWKCATVCELDAATIHLTLLLELKNYARVWVFPVIWGFQNFYRSTCTNPAAEKWQWSDLSRFPCSLANDNRHFDFNSNFFSSFSPSAKSVVKINTNGGIVIDYGRVGREMNFENPCTSLFWHNTSSYWLIAFPIFCCI